jgi:hypothetical protein
VQRRLDPNVGARFRFLVLLSFSFVSHFSRRAFCSRLLKPISAKSITAMPHLRETLREPGKTFAAMHWTSLGTLIDIRGLAKMHKIQFSVNNEPDSIQFVEKNGNNGNSKKR